MSENVKAVRLEYTVGRERVMIVVCSMTVERAEVRAENERKSRKVGARA